jgi:hypothetical protein
MSDRSDGRSVQADLHGADVKRASACGRSQEAARQVVQRERGEP